MSIFLCSLWAVLFFETPHILFFCLFGGDTRCSPSYPSHFLGFAMMPFVTHDTHLVQQEKKQKKQIRAGLYADFKAPGEGFALLKI